MRDEVIRLTVRDREAAVHVTSHQAASFAHRTATGRRAASLDFSQPWIRPHPLPRSGPGLVFAHRPGPPFLRGRWGHGGGGCTTSPAHWSALRVLGGAIHGHRLSPSASPRCDPRHQADGGPFRCPPIPILLSPLVGATDCVRLHLMARTSLGTFLLLSIVGAASYDAFSFDECGMSCSSRQRSAHGDSDGWSEPGRSPWPTRSACRHAAVACGQPLPNCD
jgi:hypothetical protein